ncbi:hypothetical protein [Thermocoleostomius sinensis]|jgi:hypothetical protein|uniref:Uncharacterized protein n=1 Tax=Thermocoleostomius sinensis A174 TaxID=2016057 RepID=A0A9E8ZGK7_9CYAN|nr:hypothetical protein [Thermocoleostomius sinensis]WAL61454.1 hypothetical protein OXH18_05540 [Thermocoleostomius sinensis A174]
MSTTTDYTPEELTTLAAAVMLSGMAVSMVDVGVVSTAIEANAMAQEVAGAAKRYPDNAVIQALFSEDAARRAKDQGLKIEVRPEEMKPETAVNTAIDRINAALTILNTKATPEEIQEYKEFIYACADRVANAAGSGLFGAGEKVSPQEAAALDQLRVALEL